MRFGATNPLDQCFVILVKIMLVWGRGGARHAIYYSGGSCELVIITRMMYCLGKNQETPAYSDVQAYIPCGSLEVFNPCVHSALLHGSMGESPSGIWQVIAASLFYFQLISKENLKLFIFCRHTVSFKI